MKNSSDIKIWRYLSLPKFIDFILNENIAFSRADTFADKKEGISNELIQLINTYKTEKEKYQKTTQIFLMLELRTLLADYFYILFQKKKKNNLNELIAEQKKYFISSWFASEHESMAMWNLYSKNDSVALQTTADIIVNAVKIANPFSDHDNFKHQHVDYKNISNITNDCFLNKKNMLDLLFRKDLSYSHEKEYRFILFEKDGGAQIPSRPIKIDHSELSKFKIIAHPFMPDWQFKNLIQLCVKKIISKNISKSSLT